VPTAGSCFDRFIRALHRRYVVLRALERTGLGILAGCAVGVVLTPILLWRGEPAWILAAACLGGGALAGILWGVQSRPSLLEAAAEADRQLRLDDLLGTSLVLRAAHAARRAPDPWAGNILALAEDRCRRTSPSAVLFHRLGARAWGGISLSAALVLTLAALSTSPTDTRAALAARDAVGRDSPDDTADPDERPLVDPRETAPRRRPQPTEEEGADRPGSETENVAARPGDEGDPAEGGDAADPSSDPTAAATDGDGTEGAGRTESPDAADARPDLSGTSADAAPDGDGRPSAGTGRPGEDVAAGDAGFPSSATSAGNGEPPAEPAPPWRSETWAADVERARQAVEAGRIPDAYRDLVRAYFETDRR
jgi:hypothetical protein